MNEQTITPRVELRGISKSFPGVQALKNVDFKLMPNEIHALVGENGAGKSVMLKCLLGSYIKDTGEIYIDGEKKEITNTAIGRKEGLSAVWQDLMLANTLSVAENICLGMLPSKAGFVDFKKMREMAQAVCDKYGIDLDMNAKVRELIVAHRQMVAIAKALALDCKVLVLDEPTAMLTDEETTILFDAMRTLKEKGISIIYVSHRMEEIFEICDTVTVLRDGEQVGHFDMKDVRTDDLIRCMSGRSIENLYGDKLPQEGRVTDEVILEVENITKHNVFKDISFNVRKGEIVGFFGLVGSKRTDVMRAIFGVDKYNSGKVTFKGEELTNGSARKNIDKGVGLLPEDRLNQSVCTRLSVAWNINMADFKRNKKGLFMSAKGENDIAQNYIDLFKIRTPGPKQLVRNLSGGNQQKVAVAKWFNISPEMILFDEPTIGVDVGAKLEIYNYIRDFASKGGTAIMVSSYLPELMGVCDRVIVMNNGRITGCLPTEGTTEEEVLSLAFAEEEKGEEI